MEKQEQEIVGVYRGWQNRLYALDQKFNAAQPMTMAELQEGKSLAEALGYERAAHRYNALIERQERAAQQVREFYFTRALAAAWNRTPSLGVTINQLPE